MKYLTSAIAAAALLAAASPSVAATSWNAYDSFQVVNGAVQTGPFAGGTSSGPFAGTMTPFALSEANCGGSPDVFCQRTAEASVSKAYAGDFDPANSVFYTAGFLNMHPDPVLDSVLQFVAPSAGDYRFAGSFAIHDSSPTGVTIGGYVGAAPQFANLLLAGAQAFDFEATLAAGDRVSFVLGAAGNYTYDSTGLSLTVTSLDDTVGGVPEPATWAMMILGFAGAGAALRRRRVGVA
jgi:hypothetical protein